MTNKNKRKIKPWSISTTMRNPDRLREVLLNVMQFEGQEKSPETQDKLQISLIHDRKYKPTQKKDLWEHKYDDLNYDFTLEEAEEVFRLQNYKGGAGIRGRTSLSPLKELGFVFIDNNKKIRISASGYDLIKDDFNLESTVLHALLKFQYRNPLNTKYGAEFNIRPLIVTMHLINEVNKRASKPSGISREEFNIFVPTLIDAANVNSYADTIIEFRKLSKDKKQEKMLEFVQNFYEDDSITLESTEYKNLEDYGDNARRYFRITKLFNFKGNYVNLEPRRKREIDLLLEEYDGSADGLDKESYIKYITNDSIILPWESKGNLIAIIKDVIKDIKNNFDITKLEIKEYSNFNTEQLSGYIEYLRGYRTKQQRIKDHDESQTIDAIAKYIDEFENLYKSTKKLSIELERLATLALNAINDAIEIKPNYPVGDDGEPTFTAPGKVADIECYYKDFNSICEVTMLKSRDQWVNEGQPVMRHLRDFEDKFSKDSYCVFIAPKIHRDTANTFYIANKFEYEGKKQKIIPLTITQFVNILKTVLRLKENGKQISHQEFQKLLDSVIDYCNEEEVDSTKWMDNMDKQLENWSQNLLN